MCVWKCALLCIPEDTNLEPAEHRPSNVNCVYTLGKESKENKFKYSSALIEGKTDHMGGNGNYKT